MASVSNDSYAASPELDEHVDPELVRTSSYSKAMENGTTGHEAFVKQMHNAPSILGTTKTFIAPLVRPRHGGYGFEMSTNDTNHHHVQKVFQDGSVCHILQEDDEVELVNDKQADGMDHESIVKEMEAPALNLCIRRHNEFYKDVAITRQSLEESYGIHIGSSPQDGAAPLEKVFVSSVVAGSPADGHLTNGDVIIAVNTRLIGSMTYSGLTEMIQGANKVRFTILRSEITRSSVSVSLEGRPAVLIVFAKLKRSAVDVPFGIHIGHVSDSNYQVITGAEVQSLQVGDEIVKCNGVDCLNKTHEEVVSYINKSTEVEFELHRAITFNKDAQHTTVPRTYIVPSMDSAEVNRSMPRAKVSDVVTISRTNVDASWGMSFGTADQHLIHSVTDVKDSSPCFGKLQQHDEIVTVNDKDGMSMTHGNVIQEFKESTEVVLAICRHNSFEAYSTDVEERVATAVETAKTSRFHKRPDVSFQNMTVHLNRDSTDVSYGFGLGEDDNSETFISMITVGGLADGKLQENDKVIAVGQTLIKGMAHNDIVGMITSEVAVSLTLERPNGPDDNLEAHEAVHTYLQNRASVSRMAFDRVSVTIGKGPDGGFGFGIGTLNNGEVLITHISDNVASQLQVADLICKVNGFEVQDKSHGELVTAITASETVTLEVQREAQTPAANDINKRNSIREAQPGINVESRTVNNIGQE